MNSMMQEGTAPQEQDNVFFDGDTAWGSDDESETSEEEQEESTEEPAKEESEEESSSKSNSSAIHQKVRYRKQLQEAKERIAELEKAQQTGGLTPEQQKEQAAQNFLRGQIETALAQIKAKEESEKQQAEEAFEEEIVAVLDENKNLTEEEIRSVVEELEVTPTQAAKIIEREQKRVKKEKPKVPQEKRASTAPAKQTPDEPKEKRTLDSVARRIKEGLSRGDY